MAILLHVLASCVIAQAPVSDSATADNGPNLQRPRDRAARTPLDDPDGMPVLPPSLRAGPLSPTATAPKPRAVPQVLVDEPLPRIERYAVADARALRRDRALLGVTLGGVGLIGIGVTAMWMPWAVESAYWTLNPPTCGPEDGMCYGEGYVEFGIMIGGSALVGAGIVTAAIAGTLRKRHRQRHGLGRWAGTIRPSGGGLSMTF